MSTPKLYYFDIPGKAEAARLACQYAGFPMEDVRLSKEEFLAMKEAGKLPFGQVHFALFERSALYVVMELRSAGAGDGRR